VASAGVPSSGALGRHLDTPFQGVSTISHASPSARQSHVAIQLASDHGLHRPHSEAVARRLSDRRDLGLAGPHVEDGIRRVSLGEDALVLFVVDMVRPPFTELRNDLTLKRRFVLFGFIHPIPRSLAMVFYMQVMARVTRATPSPVTQVGRERDSEGR
jgi:hypothetical protein